MSSCAYLVSAGKLHLLLECAATHQQTGCPAIAPEDRTSASQPYTANSVGSGGSHAPNFQKRIRRRSNLYHPFHPLDSVRALKVETGECGSRKFCSAVGHAAPSQRNNHGLGHAFHVTLRLRPAQDRKPSERILARNGDLDRPSWRQPPNRLRTHVVTASNLGKRFLALVASPDGLRSLVLRELRRSPHMLPSGFCAFPAFTRTGADQFAFELGKPTKNRQHQTPVRRGGVRPCVGKRFETGVALGDLRQRVQQVAR